MTRTLALAIVIVLSSVAPAAAQPEDEMPVDPRSRALLEDGLRAFGNRNYAGAIDSFRRGYGLEPRRVFLFAWAQAERLSGNCAEAISLYHQFLRQEPPEPQAARAREGLGLCPSAPRPAIAERAASSPPRHHETSRRPPFWTDPVGDTLAGTGVAALVVSLSFVIVANGHATDANRAATLGDWREAEQTARDQRLVALVTGGIGVALVAAGVLRFLLADPSAPVETVIGRSGIVIARWSP